MGRVGGWGRLVGWATASAGECKHAFLEASSPTRQARTTSSPSQVLLPSLLLPLPCLLTLPLSWMQCKTARRQAQAGGDEIPLLCQNLTSYLCSVLLLLCTVPWLCSDQIVPICFAGSTICCISFLLVKVSCSIS